MKYPCIFPNKTYLWHLDATTITFWVFPDCSLVVFHGQKLNYTLRPKMIVCVSNFGKIKERWPLTK